MPNRLSNATSPYLLQHADNPVDWYEWGEDAFSAAREEDRPVLLSIGYSACHWCHVMAHESFEDETTAAYLNEHFVCIKVDREERPDVDRIYMDAVQAMTGRGGWPMTMFLTTSGEPFYAGTYYPKEQRGNMPSFRQILEAVVDAWGTKRDQLLDQAGKLTTAIDAGMPAGVAPPTDLAVEKALAALTESFDATWGGFGAAPKFPQAPVLEFLVKIEALEPGRFPIEPMMRRTLDAMRAGGIYDQIGGGFARYSVDGEWLIPHFEKMLYDNALLAGVYLHAGQIFAEARYLETARGVLDYLAGTMRDDAGGIHAAEDADSEGLEGKYYVWGYNEFRRVAGDDADLIGELYGVTPHGNFEGLNNLHQAKTVAELAGVHGVSAATVAEAKSRVDSALLAARGKRVPPGRDDKVIAAWNGLAMRSFAEAAAVFADAAYLAMATGIAEFITNEMIDSNGRLARSWRGGRTSGHGFCVDYAAVAVGLLALYQSTGDERWYRRAANLTESMIELFGGDTGFFTPEKGSSSLITRPRDFMDNPLPSANSLAAEAVASLAAFRGEGGDELFGIRRGAARLLEQAPHAVAHLLGILYVEEVGRREVAIVGATGPVADLRRVYWETYRPDCVVAVGTGDSGTDPAAPGPPGTARWGGRPRLPESRM